MFFQITIDGPSGSGKSSLAKALSEKIQYLYVNTGTIFRGISWYLSKFPGITIEDALTEIVKHKNFIFKKNCWFFNEKKIDEKTLRTKEISKKSSEIATNPTLRKFILAMEKKIALNENVIMEGRDIGTTVFPNAILKIFLTAKPETRALRRYLELKEKGMLEGRTMEELKDEIIERDKRDYERGESPLRKADEAIEISSDNKKIEEIVSEVSQLLNERLSKIKT